MLHYLVGVASIPCKAVEGYGTIFYLRTCLYTTIVVTRKTGVVLSSSHVRPHVRHGYGDSGDQMVTQRHHSTSTAGDSRSTPLVDSIGLGKQYARNIVLNNPGSWI